MGVKTELIAVGKVFQSRVSVQYIDSYRHVFKGDPLMPGCPPDLSFIVTHDSALQVGMAPKKNGGSNECISSYTPITRLKSSVRRL